MPPKLTQKWGQTCTMFVQVYRYCTGTVPVQNSLCVACGQFWSLLYRYCTGTPGQKSAPTSRARSGHSRTRNLVIFKPLESLKNPLSNPSGLNERACAQKKLCPFYPQLVGRINPLVDFSHLFHFFWPLGVPSNLQIIIPCLLGLGAGVQSGLGLLVTPGAFLGVKTRLICMFYLKLAQTHLSCNIN